MVSGCVSNEYLDFDNVKFNIFNNRNGFYKMGLHGSWCVGMYNKKCNLKKEFHTRTIQYDSLIFFR